MLQPVLSNFPLHTASPLVRPIVIEQTPSIHPLSHTDHFFSSLSANQDTDALVALQYLESHVGSLKKSGFFSNPRIDINEALSRLKKGDTVLINHHAVHNVTDYFETIKELYMVDDLMGRRHDHGVTKPELRLPLLFLDGHTLSPYMNDDRHPYHDAYTAYRELNRDWRIRIDNHSVKPNELASYVVNKGWTQPKDPGLNILAQFKALSENGWAINGQTVRRDVAYMALLTGSQALSYEGMAVRNAQDFAVLMNLVANQDNGAVLPDLKSRLMTLDLKQFSSPNISNYYTVYQHLNSGQTLSYKGNSLASLKDVILYDALEGSKKATDLLPAPIQEALLYLNTDKGFSKGALPINAYQAYQALVQGEMVTYSFTGGPLGQILTLKSSSLEHLLEMKSQVIAQREADQFRPDFREAKSLLQERLPSFEQPLQENLQKSLDAAEAARQIIPEQQRKLREAKADYDRIKPEHDRALNAYKEAQSVYTQTERTYNSAKRAYEQIRDRYERLERNYEWEQRHYYDATSHARQSEDMARREDQLAVSDPQNAETHRKKANQYRAQAEAYRRDADRHYRDMQQIRWEMDRLRYDVDRALYTMESAQREYRQAERLMDAKQREWNHQKILLNETESRITEASHTLGEAEKTVQQTETIQQLTQMAKTELQTLNPLVEQMAHYDDYAKNHDALHGAMKRLGQSLSDKTYLQIHGQQLHNQVIPLLTLFTNMDKPARP